MLVAAVIMAVCGLLAGKFKKIHWIADYALPVSLTLPLRDEPYTSPTLFPFFDGLIPEGWLLDIAVHNWKISENDRFGLLLTTCRDCIGNVNIRSLTQ